MEDYAESTHSKGDMMDRTHASPPTTAGQQALSGTSAHAEQEQLSEVQARVRQAELGAAVGAAMIRRAPLPVQLQQCAEAMVSHLDVVFSRIWTFNDTTGTLELQASKGPSPLLKEPHDGMPLSALKIGRIALNRAPHLTKAVLDDAEISDQDWARRAGMVALAGYPLVVDERVIGGLAVFARHPLDEATLRALGSVAPTLALGIDRAWAGIQHDYRSLIETMMASLGEGVCALDREGRLTFMNPAAEGLLGWSADELRGQELHAALPVQHAGGTEAEAEACPLLSVIRSGATRRINDAVFRGKDGRLLPVSYTMSPLVREGQVVGAMLIFHDNSAHRAIEQAREEFLLAAHDLKTPVTSIQGNTQLARRRLARMDSPQTAAVSEPLGRIEEATAQMVTQIDEVVDVTRLRLGADLELDRRSIDLVALVRAVVGQHEGLIPHRLRVETSVTSLQGHVDAARLTRVVNNLVDNAIKYSPAAGLITVELGREESAAGAQVRIVVRDQGIGVPADDLPHIFTRFYRSPAVVGRMTGTGIGLASVRQIVEQHGGRVAVESQEGEGSTFTVWAPLR